MRRTKSVSSQITWDVNLCTFNLFLAAPAKKEKKGKEPEAPILYEDPPDKTDSKDGRAANMKITSWNVDGLRAWVKKKGLDVRYQMAHATLALHFAKSCKSLHSLLLSSRSGYVRRIQMCCACKKRSVLRNPCRLTSLTCPSIHTSTGLDQRTKRVTVEWRCYARLSPSMSPTVLVSSVWFVCLEIFLCVLVLQNYTCLVYYR